MFAVTPFAIEAVRGQDMFAYCVLAVCFAGGHFVAAHGGCGSCVVRCQGLSYKACTKSNGSRHDNDFEPRVSWEEASLPGTYFRSESGCEGKPLGTKQEVRQQRQGQDEDAVSAFLTILSRARLGLGFANYHALYCSPKDAQLFQS